MKLTKLLQTDKLQAVTRRMSRRVAEEYAQEPSIKLSSAFLVVLILHVVAVGGIYAFNSIKTHKILPALEVTSSADPAGLERSETPQAAVSRTPAKTHRVRAGETVEKIAALYGLSTSELTSANDLQKGAALKVGQELRIPARTASKPAPESKTNATADPKKLDPTDSKVVKEPFLKGVGETYTVVKGDTPARIARKLGVRSSDLLKLNKIEDPRKLQIGQKLRVPTKSKG